MTGLLIWLLRILIFSLPSELIVTIDLIGSVTRLLGLAAIGAGVLVLVVSGRVRRPNLVVWLAVLFTFLNFMSMLWTVAYAPTLDRVATYAQLLGFVWLMWEFGADQDTQESFMFAFCMGEFVAFADLAKSFLVGHAVVKDRYTAGNLDPNDFGLTVAIGIPMAWYLFVNRRGIVRFLCGLYVPTGMVAILLTASRGSFLAGAVALSILPMLWPGRSFRSLLSGFALLACAVMAVLLIVPESSWKRLSTIGDELHSGTLSGRVEIWSAGLEVFRDRPLLGAGAGAFEAAVEPLIGPRNPPHNVFLGILAEQGSIGIIVFVLLMTVCAWRIACMPSQKRKMWAVIGVIWFIGAMSLGWQYRKTTWLVVGLIAVQRVRSKGVAEAGYAWDRYQIEGMSRPLDEINRSGVDRLTPSHVVFRAPGELR
jgi:O-antigen ligase